MLRTRVTNADSLVVAAAASPQTLAASSGSESIQSVTIAVPRRWQGTADPYLYETHVEVIDAASGRVTDVVTEPLGLRDVELQQVLRLVQQEWCQRARHLGRHAACQNSVRKIGLTEYGAGGNTTQHAQDRSFVWNMFDFASDRRSEGDQPGINDRGLVTRDRQVRKDAYCWYENWADTPTVHITSKRWVERTDPQAELKVYSNASSVSATVNAVSLGSRTSTDHIFRWPVTLKPGQTSSPCRRPSTPPW